MSSSKWIAKTPIQEFYTDSVIFITGSTGFIGSTLVEKLLRSCPNIKTIYLLIRDKKSKSSEQRLNEYFDGPFWDKLKILIPKPTEFVSLINGDMLKEDLGISLTDYEVLTQEVNVIFHAAATVRFDDPLKIAAKVNIQGTRNILELATKCQNLKSFVHVSTAYSQCIYPELEERFYPAVRDPVEFLEYCDKNSVEEVDKLTSKLIGGFPNSYTFTKHLSEQIVKKYEKVLPIAIARPSIVLGCYQEPLAGWVQNLFGPIGLMIGIAMGLVRVLFLSKTLNTDVVPADFCTNHLISISHETSKQDYKQNGIKIYNYGCGKDNPLSWREYFKWSEKFAHLYACIHMYIGFYFVITTTNPYIFKPCEFMFHIIPAYCIDAYSRIIGQKPQMVKLYRRIQKLTDLTHYFSARQWIFHNDNTKQLYESMDRNDRILFNFDICLVEWDVFFFHLVKVLRLYILKEPMSTLPMYEKKVFRMKMLNYAIFISIFLLLIWIFY